jgi:hypothetical protein
MIIFPLDLLTVGKEKACLRAVATSDQLANATRGFKRLYTWSTSIMMIWFLFGTIVYVMASLLGWDTVK